MTYFIDLDHRLFQQINSHWTGGLLDEFFPFITDAFASPWTFVVLGLAIAYWLWRARWSAARWILVLALSLSFADMISYRLLKPLVNRSRPEAVGLQPVLRTNSHSGLSFPSNHATNMFTAATVLSAPLPGLAPFFYGVAALVAYSRVYVGVHFPIDVLGGALLGIAIGHLARRLNARYSRSQKS